MQINLASGQRPFQKPWVNIDLIEQTDSQGRPYALDYKTDIRDLSMIEDNSCSVLVAHHCLEHIDMSQVGSTAKEWHRVLKPGGKLAVFVPDIKAIIKAWQEGRIDDYIFNVNVYGAYQGHIEDLHRWSYYYDYLIKQMSQDGVVWSKTEPFTEVHRQSEAYRGADIALDFWILAVELTK